MADERGPREDGAPAPDERDAGEDGAPAPDERDAGEDGALAPGNLPPPHEPAPPAEGGPPPDDPPVSNRWRRRRGAPRRRGDEPPPVPGASGRWRRRVGRRRRDAHAGPAPGRRRRWARRLGIAVGVGAVGAGLLWVTLPNPREYATEWPERTAYMERWLEGAETDARSIAYRPVPISNIPESMRRAVLVSEDAGFYGHRGFDWHEVGAALREAWEERELPRGASTISQQLARNLYLSSSRDPLRKLREALITRRIESRLSKNRILELYLNVIELGPGIYGVEAASRHYFGKSVSGLTRGEAAELAATIPSPRGNNPATRTRSFQWRARLAYARAFGGVEIDTLGPPPDTIEVAPPILADSPGAVRSDTAATDTARAGLPRLDTLGADTTSADTTAADTAAADTTRADTLRREADSNDDPARGRPLSGTGRSDPIRPDATTPFGRPGPRGRR